MPVCCLLGVCALGCSSEVVWVVHGLGARVLVGHNGVAVPVYRSPVHVHWASEFIHQKPPWPEDHAEEDRNHKPEQKDPNHHPSELLLDKITIILPHLFISLAIRLVILSPIILLILVLVSPLIEPLFCISGQPGLVIFSLYFLV